MNVTADRVAGFPGERFRFELGAEPGASDRVTEWTGGGTPATGSGRRFETVFTGGGAFTVTARDGEDRADVTVTICPIDRWISRAGMFYGPAIDFTRVKVGSSRLVMGPPGTAWTCNDVIRFKRPGARRSSLMRQR